MANRRFDVFEYRQVLVRMRQGGSDRDVERAGLMGRRAAAGARAMFGERGWLDPATPVPEPGELAAAFAWAPVGAIAPSLCEPYRERTHTWACEEIDASTIHQALQRRYGFEGVAVQVVQAWAAGCHGQPSAAARSAAMMDARCLRAVSM